jgi:hypothetical protein
MRNLFSNFYLRDVVNREELNPLYAVCRDMGMQFGTDVIERYSTSNIYYATEYLHNEIKNKTRIGDLSWTTRAGNVNPFSLNAISQTPKAHFSQMKAI